MTLSIETFEIISSALIYQGKKTMIFEVKQGANQKRSEGCDGPM
jgi:hypothetical protein